MLTTRFLIRWCKIALVGFYGVYMAVVVFGNVTDYGSNFLFVRHVMSMDTTFEDSRLGWRAIHAAWVHHAGYWLIIAWEGVVAVLCLAGAGRMVRAVRGDGRVFYDSKNWALAGLLAGLGLWFFGFQVVGGEWFAMWQSEVWNGLDSAFRLWVYTGIALLALMVKEE